ncbi:NEK1_4_5 [Mytilus coruscus]|uniref:non-specific serine/threonine protein kinase n=1 Tax=Mytilus coruscus TaxID=42192 RepID=A0A6J8EFA4_MYTCO|nr:NEK1_4_5 [Mytilus coruscus]
MAGNFELLNLIGSGTFGQAWLARNKKDNSKCVIKVVKILKMSEGELDQALTEVSVLARCKNTNIIKYLDAFVDDGSLKIVMEYADGGDLHKRIVNQKGIHFGKEAILDWFVQICFALKYIHSQNILHRDLKTQNIFLTSQNVVKIGDFGIARVLRDSADCAMTAIGTPFYLSPEICQKKPYNHKSDMWALGCVLYEMCTLHVPFNAKDFDSLVMKIMTGQFEPLPSHFGTTIRYLCTRLLDKDPDKRLSANEALNFSPLKTFVQRYEPIKRKIPTLAVRRFSSNSENKSVRKRSGSDNKIPMKKEEKSVKKSMNFISKDNQDQAVRKQSDPLRSIQVQEKFARRPSIRAECPSPKKKGIDWISDKENIDPRRLIGNKTYQVKYPKFRRFSLATPRIKRIVSQQRSSVSTDEQDKCKQFKEECVRSVLYRNIERESRQSSHPSDSTKEQENTTVDESIDDEVFSDASLVLASLEESQQTVVNLTKITSVENGKVASVESICRGPMENGRRMSNGNNRRASIEIGGLQWKSRRASIENGPKTFRGNDRNDRRKSVENNPRFGFDNRPKTTAKLQRKPTVDKNYRRVSGSEGCLVVPNPPSEDPKTIRRSCSYDAIRNEKESLNVGDSSSSINKRKKSESETYIVKKPPSGSLDNSISATNAKETSSADKEMSKYINKALYMSLQDYLQSPNTAKNKVFKRLGDIFGEAKLDEILEVCRECLYNNDNYDTFHSMLSETDVICLPLVFQYLQLEGSQ